MTTPQDGIDFSHALASGEEEGVEWAVMRSVFDAINGYARLPLGHPWRGRETEGIDVEIHGGLTYSDGAGWIGFDTLHAGDWWPGMPESFRSLKGVEWNQAMVEEEAKSLARQIAATTRSGAEHPTANQSAERPVDERGGE